MPRYKEVNYNQMQWIGVSFDEQILPGTFEYTLNDLIDNAVDLSVFHQRYNNDKTGATAFNPAVLLKIVLYAYSRGITSSRDIEACCKQNIVFMALSANTRPHFTTIADFVSTMEDEVVSLFRDILMVCYQENLIGQEMFAIDGCKLPSNAAKEWSGTKSDLKKKAQKLDKAIKRILHKHRQMDLKQQSSEIVQREQKKLETLRQRYKKITEWDDDNEDRRGPTGNVIQSNITDNESAKMMTSHGVVQGYNGVAVADSKHQVVVHAEAFGSGQETHILKPMIDSVRETFATLDSKIEDVFGNTKLTADAGYHSEANMKMLDKEKVDAYIADPQFRKRDPLFTTAVRHKPKHKKPKRFQPSDFTVDWESMRCRCPAGKPMYLENGNFQVKGRHAICFRAWKDACSECHLKGQCLRNPDQKTARQVHFFTGQTTERYEEKTYTEQMKQKIDSPEGRHIYSQRLGTVEPVFGHIRSTLGLDRFSLRGKQKVNTQWQLYCMVHNIKKIFRFGDGHAYA